KVDRADLPAPQGRRTTDGPVEAPANDTERLMAEVLGEVLGLENVSVTADFFSELGANSLLMAQFTARVRERSESGTTLSSADVYRNTTIRALAQVAGEPRPAASADRAVTTQEWRLRSDHGGRTLGRGSGVAYTLTGVAQMLLFLLACVFSATPLDGGFRWL